MSGREPRITYRRCSVFAADVESVLPGNWIGDAIVSFYFACLQEELEAQLACEKSACKAENCLSEGSSASEDEEAADPEVVATKQAAANAPSAAANDAVYLMDPMASQMAVYAQDQEEVEFDLGDIGLDRKRRVVVPVNNNTDPTRVAGGSHWSLLVYEADSQQFRHYDSAGVTNLSVAKQLAAKLGPLVNSSKKGPPTFKAVKCCQQVFSKCNLRHTILWAYDRAV